MGPELDVKMDGAVMEEAIVKVVVEENEEQEIQKSNKL